MIKHPMEILLLAFRSKELNLTQNRYPVYHFNITFGKYKISNQMYYFNGGDPSLRKYPIQKPT